MKLHTMTHARVLASALAVIGVTITASTAAAQDEQPVHWTASKSAPATTPGGKTSVALTATIDSGWHIYSVTQGPGGPFPTRISVAQGQPFTLDGKVASDKPMVAHDPNFGIDVETHEHAATFTVPVKVNATAKPGARTIKVAARYEACNAAMCLPPVTEHFTVPVAVKAKGSASGQAKS